jgi:DNA-binding MarR family transcriptional regulator
MLKVAQRGKMSPTATSTEQDQSLESDLEELSSLVWGTFRGLKQSSPPPQVLRDAVERASLGPRHMPALRAVATAGPMSVSELARRLGLGLSTTSAIVGQLSRAGLLERAEDDADRRRTIVRLDDQYCEVIGTWAIQSLTPLRDTLERLPPRARAQFLEGWRILHEEATRAASGDEVDCGT